MVSEQIQLFSLQAVLFPIIYLLIPYLIKGAIAHQWTIDESSARKIHLHPTPRVGGIAVFIAFLISSLIFYLFTKNQGIINRSEFYFVPFLLCTAAIFSLGLADDLWNLNGLVKIGFQICFAFSTWLWVGGIEHLFLPFYGQWLLPIPVSSLFTLFWITGITNTLNLIDGIDGCCSGAAAIACLGLAGIAFLTGQKWIATILCLLCLSALVFLPYNWPRAQSFVGDSGAYLYGFVLSTLSILVCYNSNQPSLVFAPVILLGLPIADTTLAIFRRISRKQHLFLADRSHIHHQLLSLGFSSMKTVLILYSACLTFAIIAISLYFVNFVNAFLISFCTILLVIVLIFNLYRLKANKNRPNS